MSGRLTDDELRRDATWAALVNPNRRVSVAAHKMLALLDDLTAARARAEAAEVKLARVEALLANADTRPPFIIGLHADGEVGPVAVPLETLRAALADPETEA